jgi:hypothetical protein
MAKMTNTELESIISANQNNAVGALNGTIGQHRSSLMDRYNGEPYGDEVADRSKIVMTDVRDTIESIKPELMDIFYGGDAVVEFTPRGSEDVDGAEQETDTVNYVFNQQNNGFMVLYTWFTDALLLKNGYVKRFWDERTVTEIEEYDELTHDEAVQIIGELQSQNDAEVELLEQWGGPEFDDFGSVVAMEPMGFKAKTTSEIKEYKIEPVPPEEILVSPQWNKLSFVGCPFVAHRSSRTVSDLIEMGFDRKQVEDLPEVDDKLDSEEAETRFSGEGFDENDLTAGGATSMRTVRVYENYIRADRDGDGVAELLQVFTGGEGGDILKRNGKLAIEEVRSTPFNTACPLPIPHKHYGLSIGELVQDLQRLRTVLVRQMIDNITMTNNPDIVVDEDSVSDTTEKDLAVTQPGRVIRVAGGPASIQYQQVPNSAGQSLQGIQYVDSVREERTGVTKHGQGLNANSLAPLAEGTVNQLMGASQKKILLIARIFAETAVAPMFLDIHADLRAGPMRSIAMKLNNEWVDIDPRTWKSRSDMTINVGLGTGDRDVQFQRLGMILGQQKEAAALGFVGPEQIHHTLSKMTELSGFKDVEAFFPDPANIPPKPPEEPRPDPAMMLAQVEMQKAQMQMQTKMAEIEIRKMDAETKRQEAETKRLDMLMTDDRTRDMKAADIEADEAKQFGEHVNGRALAHD